MKINKTLATSIFFSIMIHLIGIFYLNQEDSDKEIYVVNLSEFKEFNFIPSEKSKPPPENENKENLKKDKKEKIIEKEIIKKDEIISLKKVAKIKKIEKSKKQEKTPLLKKKTENREIKKENVEKLLKNQKTYNSKQSASKVIKNQSFKNKKSAIFNKLLTDYLTSVSFEINKIAAKAYPIQSIKRREQGTINSILVLDKQGKLIDLKVLDKAPRRLNKATIKTLKSFSFPKPPAEILNSEGRLKIKIPVNFILK